MQTEEKQTVAEETKDQSETETAETGAQDDGPSLDDLLKEFDEGVADTTETKDDKASGEPKADDETDSRLARLEAKEFKADFADMAKRVKGDLQVPERFVRGFLHDAAAENPTLNRVFNERHTNPAAFDKMVKALGKEFAREAGNLAVDKDATEDREAVVAAVRGASQSAPTDNDDIDASKVAEMSDADFEKFVKSQGATS